MNRTGDSLPHVNQRTAPTLKGHCQIMTGFKEKFKVTKLTLETVIMKNVIQKA